MSASSSSKSCSVSTTSERIEGQRPVPEQVQENLETIRNYRASLEKLKAVAADSDEHQELLAEIEESHVSLFRLWITIGRELGQKQSDSLCRVALDLLNWTKVKVASRFFLAVVGQTNLRALERALDTVDSSKRGALRGREAYVVREAFPRAFAYLAHLIHANFCAFQNAVAFAAVGDNFDPSVEFVNGINHENVKFKREKVFESYPRYVKPEPESESTKKRTRSEDAAEQSECSCDKCLQSYFRGEGDICDERMQRQHCLRKEMIADFHKFYEEKHTPPQRQSRISFNKAITVCAFRRDENTKMIAKCEKTEESVCLASPPSVLNNRSLTCPMNYLFTKMIAKSVKTGRIGLSDIAAFHLEPDVSHELPAKSEACCERE
eukprot:802831_1